MSKRADNSLVQKVARAITGSIDDERTPEEIAEKVIRLVRLADVDNRHRFPRCDVDGCRRKGVIHYCEEHDT